MGIRAHEDEAAGARRTLERALVAPWRLAEKAHEHDEKFRQEGWEDVALRPNAKAWNEHFRRDLTRVGHARERCWGETQDTQQTTLRPGGDGTWDTGGLAFSIRAQRKVQRLRAQNVCLVFTNCT